MEIEQKTQLITEAVEKLKYFVDLYGIESLFIAGGYCRSLFLNRLWETNDIDVASAYPSQALQLGGLFASEIVESPAVYYHRTGTAMVEYGSEAGSIKIEFQGNSVNAYMYNQEIRNWMHNNNIDDVPLMHNIYGRDFTINSMIYSLHNQELYDLTSRAERDFDKKLIRSILPAPLLVKNNPLVILRAIRFALTYQFTIEDELEQCMMDGFDLLYSTISQDRITQEIVRILKINSEAALKILKRFKLDKILLDKRVRELLELRSFKGE